jgi:hypothetical protein
VNFFNKNTDSTKRSITIECLSMFTTRNTTTLWG